MLFTTKNKYVAIVAKLSNLPSKVKVTMCHATSMGT